MDPAAILVAAMLLTTCAALMTGFPVAFTLAGVALLFSVLGTWMGLDGLIGNLPARIFGSAITNDTLLAVPMFVYMGVMLERSRVAENLLQALGGAFGRLPGGLAVSVVLVGTLLAASTGIVGATVVAMGVISLPTMLRSGYAPSLAAGTICAAGTLGQIIPPSIVLVILGDQISTAYQEAQSHLQQQAWAAGNTDFTPQAVSVGDLFAGALLPGLVLVALFILYLIVHGTVRPDSAPPVRHPNPHRSAQSLFGALAAPILLIVAVLGSILFGIAPPGEAASIGAIGATLLAARNAETPADDPEKTRPAPFATAGWCLGGLLFGAILGAILFVGTERFHFMTGLFAALGALALPLSARNPHLRRAARYLGRTGNLPIHAAAIALVGLAFLTLSVDFRLGRSSMGTLEYAAAGMAGILCLVAVWGIAVAFNRCHAAGILPHVNRRTVEITAMIFTILIAASLYSLVFRGLGGDDLIADLLHALPGDGFWALMAVMAVMFVLGFFLDFVEIALVVVPIVAPILLLSGQIDPVWLGILMALNLQTSFLTPPFGFALFYFRGVAPDSLRTRDLYRGVLPFIVLQIVAIGLIWAWPGLSTWLPGIVFGQ